MVRFQSPRASVWLTVIALILMCGAAVAPLLTGTMPETADGTIHLYRLPILDHAFKDGSLFPRYPVATVFGYGSPLFNFYSPLSLYPMHALHLAGMSYLNAWLFGMALYVVIAAGGAYLFGRAWGGGAVGVVTAAAYVYAPYFIYDVLWRGTTSETAALALLPYVLWSIKLQADHPSRRTFLAVIFSLALFIPMHNVTTVLGGALIALYAVFVTLSARDWKRAEMRVFGALALGALMATFYWLPAIRETPNIKIDAITAALPNIDVTRNLVSAWSAFQLPFPADPTLQQPPFAIAFGWPQLILALLGILTLARHSRRIRILLFLALVGIVFMIFMLTPASALIWKNVPLIGYSQYPTRLLGAASLLLALIAGFGASAVVARAVRLNGKMVRLGVPVAVMIVYALPLGVRTPEPEHHPQTVVDSLDFERESGFTGSSSFGEYVPIWTETLPDATDLRDLYAENTFIPRLRPPSGVTVENAAWKLTSGALTVTSAAETTLTFDWLYLPYFQARIDGVLAEVTPSEGEGRVQISVPAGTHQLDVWLAPSRTQAIATVVSFSALLATLGILGLWPLLRGKPAVAYVERFATVRETRRALIAAALVGLLGLGAKAVFDRVPNPLRQERFAEGFAAGVQTVTDANFNREITLIGYDSPPKLVPAASSAEFTLYWQAKIAPISRDYVTAFVLRTPDGLEVARADDDRPGGVETHHWRLGQYLRQQASIDVPAGTPPGTYHVFVSLYDIESGASLDIINAENNPVGVEQPLGTIQVARGVPMAIGPGGADQHIGGITFYGYSDLPDQATVGQAIDIRFTWGVQSVAPKPTVWLEWRSVDVETVYATTPVTLDSPLPFDQWQPGDVWYTWQRVFVPANLDGTVVVVVANELAMGMGQHIEIDAPERIFELPDGVTPVEAGWENGISLAGYVENDASVTLYWTTDAVITADLRRFAHLVTSDGTLVQVVDGIPADWTRPVTGWLPGEYVVDTVPLAVTAGQWLRLGFYDARTNQQILTTSGGDFIDVVRR